MNDGVSTPLRTLDADASEQRVLEHQLRALRRAEHAPRVQALTAILRLADVREPLRADTTWVAYAKRLWGEAEWNALDLSTRYGIYRQVRANLRKGR